MKLFGVPLEKNGSKVCFSGMCCSQYAVSKKVLRRKPLDIWKKAMYHSRLGYANGYEVLMHTILGGQPPTMPPADVIDWCEGFYPAGDPASPDRILGRNFYKAESDGELSPCSMQKLCNKQGTEKVATEKGIYCSWDGCNGGYCCRLDWLMISNIIRR